jgi:hypothetical protein
MILFHHIVQVLALPERTGLRERPLLLQDFEGGRIRRVLVDGDHARWNRMVRPKGLAAKLLGGFGGPRGTQHEVDGVPVRPEN